MTPRITNARYDYCTGERVMPAEFVLDPRVRSSRCWECDRPAAGALVVAGPDQRYSFYACDQHIEAVIERAIGALVRIFGHDAIAGAMTDE